jgi:hypothetical protein
LSPERNEGYAKRRARPKKDPDSNAAKIKIRKGGAARTGHNIGRFQARD